MASVAGNEGGSNDISEVGNTLFGYRSQFLKLHCRTILLKNPPFYSRRKKTALFSFNIRHPITKVLEKKQAPKIFLCELCQENNLTAFNSKEDSAQRLAVFYAKNPDKLPDEIAEYLISPLFLGSSNVYSEEWKRAVHFDSILEFEVSRIDPTTSLAFDNFSEMFRQLAFRAHKLSWFPTNEETFFFSNIEFTTSILVDSLRSCDYDLTPDAVPEAGATRTVTDRRTMACALRLFLIIIVDDEFYKRLLNTKLSPTRLELDRSAIGGDSDFWHDACKAFTDDDFVVPNLPNVPYAYAFFNPTTRTQYDVSVCKSKWVTPDKCRKWFNEAAGNFASYHEKHDRSGQHKFDAEEGLEEFCEKFCHGDRTAIFLGALSSFRGQGLINFNAGQLPKHAQADGFHAPAENAVDRVPSEKRSRRRKSHDGKSQDPTVDSASTMLHLVQAIDRNMKRNSESPQKKACLKKRTQSYKMRMRVDQVDYKKKTLELKEKAMELAQKWRAEAAAIADSNPDMSRKLLEEADKAYNDAFNPPEEESDDDEIDQSKSVGRSKSKSVGQLKDDDSDDGSLGDSD
jgi:hypothetical protein